MSTDKTQPMHLAKYRVIAVTVEVEDVGKAVEYYSSNFGIGPWVIHERVNDSIIRGEEKSHTARWATTSLGQGQLVLNLCQIVEGESIHKELIKARGEGLAVLVFGVPNLKEELAILEEKGVGVSQYTEKKTGGAYAFTEPGKIGGLVVELLEGPIWGIPPEWAPK